MNSPINNLKDPLKSILVPGANEISTETLVTILVNKGICTKDELVAVEQKIRTEEQLHKKMAYEHLKQSGTAKTGSSRNQWLRRQFSKSKLGRKLGTALFGWRWKRVKRPAPEHLSGN
ncbi:hypothetical protein KAH55_09145 [bacterium]|nr:hypothetical protein [bacterium]